MSALINVFVALTLSLSYVAFLGSAESAEAAKWSFKKDRGTRVKEGVSVEAWHLSGRSVRLYVTAIGGIKMYRSSNGLKFKHESGNTPDGNDPAIIRQPDGSLRMYYVRNKEKKSQPKGPPQSDIYSAVSDDGLNWSDDPGIRIKGDDTGGFASVPDVVNIGSGKLRMYYVGFNSQKTVDYIFTATSTDGLAWTRESGRRLPGHYVDPAVVKRGSKWLMLAATLPPPSKSGKPGKMGRQKIHLATSSNGLKWKLNKKPLITKKDGNALDPTFQKIGKNRYRIYYSTTTGKTFDGPFKVVSGILRKK